jgi:hypothetical protein
MRRQVHNRAGTAFGTAWPREFPLSFDFYWIFRLSPSNPSLGGPDSPAKPRLAKKYRQQRRDCLVIRKVSSENAFVFNMF